MKREGLIIFIVITSLAIFLRFFGLNWDQNTHLHPDERFLTMVTTNLEWPNKLSQYFDTARSPLNPHNRGYSFYVYGTWPLLLAKLLAAAMKQDSYDGFPLIGRALSAFADLFTVFFVYLLAKELLKRIDAALLAAAFYATAVLPIQLSHFFTVDPFATLMLTVALYLMAKGRGGIPLGIAVGLAMGAKISSVLFVPIVGIFFLRNFPWKKPLAHKKMLVGWMATALLFGISLGITIRVVYPYLFSGLQINPKILANWKELMALNQPTTSFPPGIQWIATTPLNPLWDMIVFGLGIPQGLLAITSLLLFLWQRIRTKTFPPLTLLFLWTILLFSYQSFSFPKPMRYFYDLYPAIAVLSSWGLVTLWRRYKPHPSFAYVIGILCLLWPLSFLAIFTRPHTRVAASMWIYTHIPKTATIAWEHWDDPLPVPLPMYIPNYHTIQLPVFNPDSPQKIQELTTLLAQADYIVLSSNRGYGAIGRAKQRFPLTKRYYEQLMSGDLGFTLVAQFTSRPTIPIPGVSLCITPPGFMYGIVTQRFDTCPKNGVTIIDDYADELFTVYDHPKVLIFQNNKTTHPLQ